MNRFQAIDTIFGNVKVIQQIPVADKRGFLNRLWCEEEFQSFGWKKPIKQINQTMTRAMGAVRGVHFQNPPHSEMKLVTCLKGKIFDVAVDVRKDSRTFLKWHSEILSASNQKAMLIPEGFAHGFQVLEAHSEILYLHSESYFPNAEGGLRADDPRIGIEWPLSISERSEKDSSYPLIKSDWKGLAL